MTAQEARQISLSNTDFQNVLNSMKSEIKEAAINGRFFVEKEVTYTLIKSYREVFEALGYKVFEQISDRFGMPLFPAKISIHW